MAHSLKRILIYTDKERINEFYIPEETNQDIAQDIKAGDILFSKDGKIVS